MTPFDDNASLIAEVSSRYRIGQVWGATTAMFF